MTRTVDEPAPPHAGGPAAPAPAATYVYAVCRGGADTALAGLPGLAPGEPVRLLPFGGLAAVVQHVPAAQFSEEALHERLADRVELERCARAHHAVVDAAAGVVAPVLPLPLATLYLGDVRATAALGADRDRFAGALRRIAGRVEWGVKVHVRPDAQHPPRPPDRVLAATRTSSPARPGHAYLDRLRGLRQEQEHRQQAGLQAAETVNRALADLAVAGRRLRAHDTALAPDRGVQLLNAAYLVAEARGGEVADTVRRLRRSPEFRDVEIELTGPWVPYSFVDEGGCDAGR